ncbi:MAG TPA: hypothetical protein VF707_02670 [Ardenticatenaceae bacterium]|jgi:hypothetical protein
MEKLGRLLVVVMLLATVIAQPQAAFACSCMMPSPPEEALEQAAVVFAGQLVEAEAAPAGGMVSTADLIPYTFEVSQVWKGEVHSTITIGSAMSSASCGYEFAVGEEYIVYGFEGEGVLQTGLCTRTAPLASAEEDLTALGEGEIPSPGNDPILVDPMPVSPNEPEAPVEVDNSNSPLNSIPPWAWVVGPVLLAGAVLAVPFMRRRG